jgi:hypothetical protein
MEACQLAVAHKDLISGSYYKILSVISPRYLKSFVNLTMRSSFI